MKDLRISLLALPLRAPVLAAAVALAGCSVPKEAGFPDVARAVEQRSGLQVVWNRGGEEDAAVRARVREVLAGALTVGGAVQIALLDNPALQGTYEELMVAQADLVQAGLLKNPALSGRVGFPLPASSGSLGYGFGVDFLMGATRDVEFVADAPGDWILRCHKSHHTMNTMSHDVPNMLGVAQAGVEEKVRAVLPGYMAMGETGMGGMMDMVTPRNTLPMMSGKGPYGAIEMGGMFTMLKVRDGLTRYDDPGWYQHPPETLARKVTLP